MTLQPIKTYQYKTMPTPYQTEALKRAMRAGRYGLFFEQRVGKTKVAIDYIGLQHLWYGCKKVLIFTPLSVRLNWVDQFKEHLSPQIEKYRIELYPNKGKDRREKATALLNETKNFESLVVILANYNTLDSIETDKFVKWNADIVIFDEVHLLRGYKSMRSKTAYRIAKYNPRVLGLTGTPIPKHPKDLFGLFRAINPEIYGHKWKDFERSYLILGGYMGKQVQKEIRNKEKLTSLMHSASMRVLRKEVMNEPSREDVVLPVELEETARKIYTDLKNKYIAELNEGKVITADMAGVRARRLQQLCGGFLKADNNKIHQVSSVKLEALKDLINTYVIEGNQKMVIVALYRQEIAAICSLIEQMEIVPLVFHGGIEERERHVSRLLFQNNPDYPIVVNQIQTGGLGISFDAAHIMVFYSLSYIHGEYHQMRDRIMGRGQKVKEVINYFLVIQKSIDEKILKMLLKEEENAFSIVDKWRWFLED